MPEFQRMVTGYQCARCGWEWLPRTGRRPTICPHCKTPYWDRPRERLLKAVKSTPDTDGPMDMEESA